MTEQPARILLSIALGHLAKETVCQACLKGGGGDEQNLEGT